jgi:hypothetical protein
MTQRTRYFLVGSSLIMVVGLCTGLIAYYNGALPLRASAGPAEFSYVPSDVTAVAYANVRSVMDSEFRERVRQLLPTGEAQDDIKDQIGLDIEHDIDTVVAGFAGTDPTKPGGVVLVRGRFDDDLIETRATQHGALVEEYRGKRLLLSPALPHGSGDAGGEVEGEVEIELPTRGGVAFLEPGLLGLGDEATLKRAIDAAADRQDITGNADLMGYVAQMELGSNAWVVSRVDAMTNTPGMPDQMRSQVDAVDWFMANANVNSGVSGTLRVEAKDDQAAEQLRDLVRGGIAAMRLMSGEDQRLAPLLNSIQLTGTGRTVAVQFSISPDVLDVINGLAAMQGLSKGDGGGGIRK